jgi:hypothetical protein
MDFMESRNVQLSLKAGKMTFTVEKAAPQEYGSQRSKRAVLTVFTESKAFPNPQSRRFEKRKVAKRSPDNTRESNTRTGRGDSTDGSSANSRTTVKGKKIPHADALSRHVVAILQESRLNPEAVRQEQAVDKYCQNLVPGKCKEGRTGSANASHPLLTHNAKSHSYAMSLVAKFTLPVNVRATGTAWLIFRQA